MAYANYNDDKKVMNGTTTLVGADMADNGSVKINVIKVLSKPLETNENEISALILVYLKLFTFN